MTFAALHLVCV